MKTVLTFVWLFFLIDHMGRRWLLMIGSIGGSLCMWFVGGYIKIAKPEDAKEGASLSPGGIAAIFMFYRKWFMSYSILHGQPLLTGPVWTAFYTPSWNGTPWVLNSEMFDTNTRSLGQGKSKPSIYVVDCKSSGRC